MNSKQTTPELSALLIKGRRLVCSLVEKGVVGDGGASDSEHGGDGGDDEERAIGTPRAWGTTRTVSREEKGECSQQCPCATQPRTPPNTAKPQGSIGPFSAVHPHIG